MIACGLDSYCVARAFLTIGPLDEQYDPLPRAGRPCALYIPVGDIKERTLPDPHPVLETTPTVSRTDLFVGFLSLGLLGFGGIAPWARHVIVERRRWLSEHEYAEFVGLGQVLPGSNTVNTSILIGQRFHGAVGAVISVVALMTMPLVVLVALAVLYARFAMMPDVRAGLDGTAAAAAGMVIGTALK